MEQELWLFSSSQADQNAGAMRQAYSALTYISMIRILHVMIVIVEPHRKGCKFFEQICLAGNNFQLICAVLVVPQGKLAFLF